MSGKEDTQEREAGQEGENEAFLAQDERTASQQTTKHVQRHDARRGISSIIMRLLMW